MWRHNTRVTAERCATTSYARPVVGAVLLDGVGGALATIGGEVRGGGVCGVGGRQPTPHVERRRRASQRERRRGCNGEVRWWCRVAWGAGLRSTKKNAS